MSSTQKPEHNESEPKTRHVRLNVDFARKLAIIANAMAQLEGRDVSSAEAAETLAPALEEQYSKYLERLLKLKKKPTK